jgi:hypothetical protein
MKMPDDLTRRATDGLVVKSVEGVEIKDAEKGEVEAIIATFGVIDKDFDVILDTAIPDGSKVKMSSYGHDLMGGLFGGGGSPVGKGALFAEENKAIFRGKLFLQTQGGRETFEILKEMGKDQEWSFGFRVMGSELPDEDWRKRGARRILTKLDCFEVSPVLRGAGVGTRTLAVKEETPPPDPAKEAARLESERKAQELAAVNASSDRRFRHGPMGIR